MRGQLEQADRSITRRRKHAGIESDEPNPREKS
jgi:hypothetical protein